MPIPIFLKTLKPKVKKAVFTPPSPLYLSIIEGTTLSLVFSNM